MYLNIVAFSLQAVSFGRASDMYFNADSRSTCVYESMTFHIDRDEAVRPHDGKSACCATLPSFDV